MEGPGFWSVALPVVLLVAFTLGLVFAKRGRLTLPSPASMLELVPVVDLVPRRGGGGGGRAVERFQDEAAGDIRIRRTDRVVPDATETDLEQSAPPPETGGGARTATSPGDTTTSGGFMNPFVSSSTTSAATDNGGAAAAAWRTVASVEAKRGTVKIVEAINGAGHELAGKCMLLGDRLQFCTADEHRYHELIVHLPCAFIKQPSNGESVPRRVLIVGGGDCGALREVLRYKTTLVDVTVIEDDAQVLAACEKYMGANAHRTHRTANGGGVHWVLDSEVGAAVSSLTEGGNAAASLNGLDLIILDAKDRPGGTPFTRDVCTDLRLLLAPGGVLVLGSYDTTGAAAPAANLRSTFPHAPLEYSFFCQSLDRQVRMLLFSNMDLKVRRAEVDGAAAARMLKTNNVLTRFYEPINIWSYVPWFMRPT